MIDIFASYPLEKELFEPLPGKTMLELGNKKTNIVWKNYFTELGYEHTSVDWNGQDGALKLDLREPLNLGTFDIITNIGTTEHVSEQEPAWRNIIEAMHLNSLFITTTPFSGWKHHGMWHPTKEFYESLAELNNLRIERLYFVSKDKGTLLFGRFVREKVTDFIMPDINLIKYNKYGK